MNTLAHANTFFFISSIGFVIVFLLIIIILFYIIRLFRSIQRIVTKIEKDINNIGDTAKEFVSQLWSSAIFSWIFGKSKKKKDLR
jgi:hypothetical protein